MVIGHGDIASALIDREDRLFFAAGVSNSRETRETEYQREVRLFLSQDIHRHIVYFSSLCVFYTDTRYAQHKRIMEALVKRHFKHYTIMRLGNITWGDNPNTLINFLRNKQSKGEKLDIQPVYRYVIDKDEFLHWVSLIPEWNCEMNITGTRMTVREIVERYVRDDSAFCTYSCA